MKRTPLRRLTPLRVKRLVEQDFTHMSRQQQRKYLLKLWGRVIVARDRECQCGAKPCRGRGVLVGHHMLRKGSHPGVAFDLDNGIALRTGCHMIVHDHTPDYWGWHVARVGLPRLETLNIRDIMARGRKQDFAAIKLYLDHQLAKHE